MLAWYAAIAQHESIAAAADEVHVESSTLSRALGRIERDVGTQLFDRRGNHLVLNENGRLFLRFAQQSVSARREVVRRIGEIGDPDNGEIQLGYLTALGPWVVRNILVPFREQAPGVRFRLGSGTADMLLEDLERGRTGFLTLGNKPDRANLDWLVLERESLYLVVGPEHRLVGSCVPVSLSDVSSEVFLFGRVGSSLRNWVQTLCLEAGFRPNIGAEITDLTTIRSLVAYGFGISILPKAHNSKEPEELSYIPLTEADAYRDIGVSQVLSRERSPIEDRFEKFLHSLSPCIKI